METSRLKNIIILTLALTNLFLLVSLARRVSAGYTARQRTEEYLVELFADNGVTLDRDAVSAKQPPSVLSLTRSTGEDQNFAAFLLGDDLSAQDEGGGIYTYQSDVGQAQFRSGGSFEVTAQIRQEDMEAYLHRLCKTFGYGNLTLSLKDGSGTAKAVQYCGGLPVANATVTFTVRDGVLSFIAGAHLPDTGIPMTGSGTPLSAVTALTVFLEARRTSGAVLSKVTDVSLCYELQSTAATPMTLTPAWVIETDTVNYYVNCMTGAVTHD